MKEEKTNVKKKSLYYALLAVGVLLLAAATVLTVYFVSNDTGRPVLDADGDTTIDDDDEDEGQNEDDATLGEAAYAAPIDYEEFARAYDTVYVNATTDFIYRHKAVDFAAEEGAPVYAMADGVVLTVSLSEELGNLISIDHGDGLVTIYRFVEPVSGLEEGDAVTRGQQIAAVAAAYGTEAADGTHLHFEVEQDGVSVDPMEYLEPASDEK